MRLTKLFFTAVITTSSLCLYSCSDKDEPDLPPPPVPFSSPINSIEANAGVNLTPRKDWIFTILNTATEYTATINGKKLTAVPKDKAYIFNGYDNQGTLTISLRHKEYGRTRAENSPSPSIPLTIEDQSTPEKFMICDPLTGIYTGKIESELSGITLYHRNALLDFKAIDLPEGAQVYITQLNKQVITPLKTGSNPASYKAIVFSENTLNSVGVLIKIDGKEYRCSLSESVPKTRLSMPVQGIGGSSVLTFDVKMDAENNVLIEAESYKKQVVEWPIESADK